MFLTGHEWDRASKSPCGVCAEEGSEEGGSEESEEASRDGEDVDEGLSQKRLLEGKTSCQLTHCG